jgi:hypothetical protein
MTRTILITLSISLIWCVGCRESSVPGQPGDAGELLNSQAESSQVVDKLDELRSLYLHAVPPNDWPEELRTLVLDPRFRKELNRQMSNFDPGEIHRCAIAYVLALTGEDTQEHVDTMLESVQRWKDGIYAKSIDDDSVPALPEALYVLWRELRSKPALHAIVTLDLDGGPAETLSLIRLSLLRDHGEDVMRAAFEVARGDFETAIGKNSTTHTFLQDIRFRMSDRFLTPGEYETELKALAQLRKKAKNRKDEYSRFVMKSVEYVLRPWPDRSPYRSRENRRRGLRRVRGAGCR